MNPDPFPLYCSYVMKVEAFLQPPLKGAVLQTYGAGHFPTQQSLLDKIAEACRRGVVVVNCSQCPHGTTHTATQVCLCSLSLSVTCVCVCARMFPLLGLQELCELGVVSGADLTVEAALTKLSFLLGQTHLSVHDVRKVKIICACRLLALSSFVVVFSVWERT